MISGRGAVARALACLVVSGWFSAAKSLPLAAAELYVGAATVDIRPDKPVALDGQRRVCISKTPTTHIYATALALESPEGDRVLDQAMMCHAIWGNPQKIISPQRAVAGLLPSHPAGRRSPRSRETFGRRFRRGRRPSPSNPAGHSG